VNGGERYGFDGIIARRGIGRGQMQTENDEKRADQKATAEKCGFRADMLI
jgi:hypothetical protein